MSVFGEMKLRRRLEGSGGFEGDYAGHKSDDGLEHRKRSRRVGEGGRRAVAGAETYPAAGSSSGEGGIPYALLPSR